jgi:hypothetical protein
VSARAITVTVTFFADLRQFMPRGRDGPQRYTVHEGAAVADLLAAIGIEQGVWAIWRKPNDTARITNAAATGFRFMVCSHLRTPS